MIKYRVEYFESELGWGTDRWKIDYPTQQEAMDAFEECHKEFMNKEQTPSYYIVPTYIGKVEVDE